MPKSLGQCPRNLSSTCKPRMAVPSRRAPFEAWKDSDEQDTTTQQGPFSPKSQAMLGLRRGAWSGMRLWRIGPKEIRASRVFLLSNSKSSLFLGLRLAEV